MVILDNIHCQATTVMIIKSVVLVEVLVKMENGMMEGQNEVGHHMPGKTYKLA